MSIKAFDLVPAIERIKLMSDKAKTQVNIVVTVIENFKEYTRSFSVISRTSTRLPIGLTGSSLGNPYVIFKINKVLTLSLDSHIYAVIRFVCTVHTLLSKD